jgi:beta-phosphoglucomutase-like phosphatase (HAD superfamily)
MTAASPSSPPDGAGYEALIFDWDGTLVDSREICFHGLARALADVDVVLDPRWYWPREAIASPDILVLWEQEFGPLPEPIDEIIVRCRTYVMAAAPHLVIIDEYARIARAARSHGQRLAIGANRQGATADRPGVLPTHPRHPPQGHQRRDPRRAVRRPEPRRPGRHSW